ncbi:MAG: response regulator [Bacteroidetes bacterium]|nr:response regulator [Bacteroidota bacterium]
MKKPIFLLVEDILVNRLLLKKLITMEYPEAEVLEAENGQQALGMLDSTLPDMIFMDIQMPVMGGVEATIEIRKRTKAEKAPIIALTAGILADERKTSLNAGMNDYLVKPVSQQDLKTVFKKYLSTND